MKRRGVFGVGFNAMGATGEGGLFPFAPLRLCVKILSSYTHA